jgi:hypothetical protein
MGMSCLKVMCHHSVVLNQIYLHIQTNTTNKNSGYPFGSLQHIRIAADFIVIVM